jgi:hypothetical protein
MDQNARTALANELRSRILELEAELETHQAALRGLLLGEEPPTDVER